MANVQITDNRNLLVSIWAEENSIKNLIHKKIIQKAHFISPECCLARCKIGAFKTMAEELENVSHKILSVRYTSAARYVSSDPADESSGKKTVEK